MREVGRFWLFAASMLGGAIGLGVLILAPAAIVYWLTGSPLATFITAMSILMGYISYAVAKHD